MDENTMTPAAFALALTEAHGTIEALAAEELADELANSGLDGLVDDDGDDMDDAAALAAVNDQLAAIAAPDLCFVEELPLARAREIGRAYLCYTPADGTTVEEWELRVSRTSLCVEVSAMASTSALRAFVLEHAGRFRAARHEDRRAAILEELEELADEEIAIRWDAADWIDMASAEIIADALRRGRGIGAVEGFDGLVASLLDRAGEDGACVVDEEDLRGAVLALLDGFADGEDGREERAAARMVEEVRLHRAGLVEVLGFSFEWLMGLPQELCDEDPICRRGGSVYRLTERAGDLPAGSRIEYDSNGPWATVLVPKGAR